MNDIPKDPLIECRGDLIECPKLTQLRAENARLRALAELVQKDGKDGVLVEALEAISPEQYEVLADWFNMKFPDNPNREVQKDLWKAAAIIRESLAAARALMGEGKEKK